MDTPEGTTAVEVNNVYSDNPFGFGTITSGTSGLEWIAFVNADRDGKFTAMYTAQLPFGCTMI